MYIVYSFIFCISCIVKMQESSRRGSLLPPFPLVPVGWKEVDFPLMHLTLTSLHPSHALGHTSPGVGRGWEGFREVIVPDSLPPPHRVPPFLALSFSFLYIVIFCTVRFKLGFFSEINKRHFFISVFDGLFFLLVKGIFSFF